MEVGGVRIHAAAADTLGDVGAARAELRPLAERGEADDEGGAEGDGQEKPRLPEDEPPAGLGEEQQRGAIAGEDRAHDREDEEGDKPRRAFFSPGLGLEEIHGGGKRVGR